MPKADAEQETEIDQSAVQAALEKLKKNAEPEAGFMLVCQQAHAAQHFLRTELAVAPRLAAELI